MTPNQMKLVRDSFERATQQDDRLGERFLELLIKYSPSGAASRYIEPVRLAPVLLQQIRILLLQLSELTILVAKVQGMMQCHLQRELTPELLQAAHDAWLTAIKRSLGPRYYTKDVANAWETAMAIVFGAMQPRPQSRTAMRPAPSGWRRLLRPVQLHHA